jgi:anti-sigma B factor antagonist
MKTNRLHIVTPSEDVDPAAGDPPWQVNRTMQGDSALIEAGGAIDLITAPMLEQQLEYAEATTVPPAPVVVDLTRIAFIDARGLDTLVHHHQRCRSVGSTLRIVARQRAVLRPIHIAGLDTTLYVFPNAHDALHPRSA